MYVCEVRKKGTVGRALAVECMSLWDITEGFKILFVYSNIFKILSNAILADAEPFLQGEKNYTKRLRVKHGLILFLICFTSWLCISVFH